MYTKARLPKWFVANCISIPSCESVKGGAITPALLLPIPGQGGTEANNTNSRIVRVGTDEKGKAKGSMRSPIVCNSQDKSFRDGILHCNRIITRVLQMSYMRMLRGRPKELQFDAKVLTDDIELRSNSITSTLAFGISLIIFSFTFLPLSTFRTAIITCTPCNARTRAVSAPIPLDAPDTWRTNIQYILQVELVS